MRFNVGVGLGPFRATQGLGPPKVGRGTFGPMIQGHKDLNRLATSVFEDPDRRTAKGGWLLRDSCFLMFDLFVVNWLVFAVAKGPDNVDATPWWFLLPLALCAFMHVHAYRTKGRES